MKALVTGSCGFVGHYVRQELEEHGYVVTGLDVKEDPKTLQADLLNGQQMMTIIASVQPDVIIHLAGQANVAQSWEIPQRTMELNVIGTLNLMDAVRTHAPNARTVLIGSSDQYGALGAAGQSVCETLETKPQTPYAVSKKAQEDIALVYQRAYGLNLCMTRSFNHGGAGQQEGFLIPDFAAGIARIEKGLSTCLCVGNLTSRRDFTHVRDVARAYRLIAERGHAGEIYNVGSGTAVSAQEILDKLRAMASCPIPVEQDSTKMRISDTPVVCCDHSKLTAHTDWSPKISLDDMLRDTLEYWRIKCAIGEHK